ncbi:HD domain-containing protein [Nanohaloarchaea archaeon H01]|nr:HD domain-containing protein [Nanohaloarchaea archaeon H01]
MNESDLLDIFRDINEIKHKEREGWIDMGIEQPRDTIASHTFGATIIGWILSEKEEFDTEKVIKMLLLHDLIMAYIPGYTPEDEEFDSKKELEEERLKKLVEDVPDTVEQEFEELLA